MEMMTISKCFLYIAIACALGLANFYYVINGMANGHWIAASLNIIAVGVVVWGVFWDYRCAKRIEEQMQHNIQTVMKLQLFDLMRKAFENRSDFNPNGFGDKPKDKDDEVEEHNGTPV